MPATLSSSRPVRRVLVVEDDFLIAEDLAYELQEQGFVVDGPVPTMAEATDFLVGPHQPDLVILDVRLADGLSYPLADELERRSIPFVFATGCDPSSVPSRFAHVACWQKPVERAAYSAVLASWAAQTMMAQESA